MDEPKDERKEATCRCCGKKFLTVFGGPYATCSGCLDKWIEWREGNGEHPGVPTCGSGQPIFKKG